MLKKGFAWLPVLISGAAIVIAVGGFLTYRWAHRLNVRESASSNSTSGLAVTTSTAGIPAPSSTVGIVITSPAPNSLITLPVAVKGWIDGNGWTANEGEAGNVELLDANGKPVSDDEILKTTTDWLKLPTSFWVSVGDQKMMSHITTNTGYLEFISEVEKDG